MFVYNTSSVLDSVSDCMDTRFYIYSIMDYNVIDVVIIYGEPREGCINIQFDQENGFCEMVRHMIEEHHITRPHFMAGMRNNSFSDNRLNVFKQVLKEHNLPFDESMVSYGDFWSGPTEAATEEIVASGNLPEAIICANDIMAIAVCGVLSKHRIKIPEQVAVTGFDGIQEINFSSPRITSATCDSADLAAGTLEILQNLDRLQNEPRSFFVPARLALAETCGCKDKVPVDASRYLNSLNNRFFLYQDEALKLSAIMGKIQRCETAEQIVEQLRNSMFYDMCCVMEKTFFDDVINPEECNMESFGAADREMLLLFDSNHYEDFKPYSFRLNQIVPSLQYCLDNNRVIVFNALQHMGVPMGYVCYYFMRLDHIQGSRITQMVHSLSTAFGGYRNMRYKNFLMQQIDEMYRTDTLTGLYNRRGFALAYQKLLETKRDYTQMTIILADLDRLKFINDTYGHKEGDFAIRAVAETLQKACPPGSLLTRFGGDEMLAVCPGRMEPEDIRTAFTKYFAEFNSHSDKTYAVEASIGVYITEENALLSFEELIEKSDRLMYEEKERHRRKLMKQ